MSRRKGGFQVSISMIIGIVFAVLVLGLGIAWISSTFKGIQSVSDSTIQQAKNRIITGAVDRADVVLPSSKMRRDRGMEMAVVVGNKFDTKKTFKITIQSLGGVTNSGTSIRASTAMTFFSFSPPSVANPPTNPAGVFMYQLKPNEVNNIKIKMLPNKDKIGTNDNNLGTYTFQIIVYDCDDLQGTKCDDIYKQLVFEITLSNQ